MAIYEIGAARMAGDFGDRSIRKGDIDPPITGADTVIQAFFRYIDGLQRKYKRLAGAVGAVRAGTHIPVRKNFSICHNNGLRTDGTYINTDGNKLGIVPINVRILPV